MKASGVVIMPTTRSTAFATHSPWLLLEVLPSSYVMLAPRGRKGCSRCPLVSVVARRKAVRRRRPRVSRQEIHELPADLAHRPPAGRRPAGAGRARTGRPAAGLAR